MTRSGSFSRSITDRQRYAGRSTIDAIATLSVNVAEGLNTDLATEVINASTHGDERATSAYRHCRPSLRLVEGP